MLKNKILGLWQLFRFELPFTAGTCVILGELLALGRLPSLAQGVYGFLSVFFISATALILNDYFDIESDKINSPSRPLPAGLVSKSEVVLLSIIVTILGLISSFLISIKILIISFCVWLIGFLYDWHFKKSGLLGNIFVSFSVGMTFIIAGIIVNKPFEPIVWFLAILVLFINLGEEIAADALDVVGDRQTRSQSLAVIFGEQKALKIAVTIFSLVSLTSLIPFLLKAIHWQYFLPTICLDIIIIFSAVRLLDHHRTNRIQYIRAIYLGALAIMIIFIILRIILA